MNDAQFHAFMIHPRTGQRLRDMVEDNRRVDAELDAREQRRIAESNQEIYIRAIRRMFEEDDACR